MQLILKLPVAGFEDGGFLFDVADFLLDRFGFRGFSGIGFRLSHQATNLFRRSVGFGLQGLQFGGGCPPARINRQKLVHHRGVQAFAVNSSLYSVRLLTNQFAIKHV